MNSGVNKAKYCINLSKKKLKNYLIVSKPRQNLKIMKIIDLNLSEYEVKLSKDFGDEIIL